jgi:hypothetical protein
MIVPDQAAMPGKLVMADSPRSGISTLGVRRVELAAGIRPGGRAGSGSADVGRIITYDNFEAFCNNCRSGKMYVTFAPNSAKLRLVKAGLMR